MKASRWVRGLVFPVLMSIYMSFLMTGLITWVNTGLAGDFFARWWRAFYIAWPIAFLLVYFGASRIRALSERIVKAKA
ncbi:MAG: DUF2798 domain-containing protein [Idiomarina sp.]|nr:DUF2798 domain-containing protein [Idiomarina sp.]